MIWLSNFYEDRNKAMIFSSNETFRYINRFTEDSNYELGPKFNFEDLTYGMKAIIAPKELSYWDES